MFDYFMSVNKVIDEEIKKVKFIRLVAFYNSERPEDIYEWLM